MLIKKFWTIVFFKYIVYCKLNYRELESAYTAYYVVDNIIGVMIHRNSAATCGSFSDSMNPIIKDVNCNLLLSKTFM